MGHPLGLEIMRGELISTPGQGTSLWMDTNGQPRIATVTLTLNAVWPSNQTIPLGLNDERLDGAMLYTPVVGPSTRAVGGREFVLERDGQTAWLPLRVGQKLMARVREICEAGDTPLSPDTMVLSLNPRLAARMPSLAAGAVIKITTDSTPDLRGVLTAISGGPAVVQAGKAAKFDKSHENWHTRNPRSAVGWNDNYFFLVVVDGRQPGVSVGMNLPELASYLIKLGCREAMNLDGGGSSTLWAYGQVLNSPCEGRERPMSNALVLVQKPSSSSRPRPGEAVAGHAERPAHPSASQ